MCCSNDCGLTPAEKAIDKQARDLVTATGKLTPKRSAICACCRLPMERPRTRWLVVIGRGYRPSLKALCARCNDAIAYAASGGTQIGRTHVLICGLDSWEARCSRERTLQRAHPNELDASKGDIS